MTYHEAIRFLNRLPRFATDYNRALKPGFERINALLEAMGNPHLGYPSVHVAGTNGKGSTASLIASIATSAGLRTGLHTSPHLLKVNERMRLDGQEAPDAWLAKTIQIYKRDIEHIAPSFFETTVALSLFYFYEMRVDLAVVEVGLGGRLDATNILYPLVSVITSIGLDHTQILGDTLEEIAFEKGGILKPETPAVCHVLQPEAREVIARLAKQKAVPLFWADQEVDVLSATMSDDGWVCSLRTPNNTYTDLQIALSGEHQLQNIQTAIRTSEILFPALALEEVPVAKGLKELKTNTGLKGRLEIVSKEPLILLDVGHNIAGFSFTLDYIQRKLESASGKLSIAFSAKRDKDIVLMFELISSICDSLYLVPFKDERSASVEELMLMAHSQDLDAYPVASVEEAKRSFLNNASRNDILLVTGSHQIVAQYLGFESVDSC